MPEISGKNMTTPCAGAGATYGTYGSNESKACCGVCGSELIENPNSLTSCGPSWCPKCQCYPTSFIFGGVGVSPMSYAATLICISLDEYDRLKKENETFNMLRFEVKKFAQAMEKELKENDEKGGWEECTRDWLLKRARQELDYLGNSLHDLSKYEENPAFKPMVQTQILHKCADAANYIMMIADVTKSMK